MLKPEGATETIKLRAFPCRRQIFSVLTVGSILSTAFSWSNKIKKLTVGAEVIDQDYLLDQRRRTSHQDTEPDKRRDRELDNEKLKVLKVLFVFLFLLRLDTFWWCGAEWSEPHCGTWWWCSWTEGPCHSSGTHTCRKRYQRFFYNLFLQNHSVCVHTSFVKKNKAFKC